MINGTPEMNFKVFLDALLHSEVKSILNLPIDTWYFTLLAMSSDPFPTYENARLIWKPYIKVTLNVTNVSVDI